MTLNKALGYVLLVLGLVLIGWVLWQSYSVFNGKAEAPLVFKTPNTQQASKNGVKTLEQQLQAQMDEAIQKQLSQILPAGTITKVLNLAAWSMLAVILLWGGGVISGIGVKLIKSVS